MKIRSDISRKVALALNFLIVALEILSLSMSENGIKNIIYYTNCSNVLLLAASVIWIIVTLRKKDLPKWVQIFKLMSVVSVAITFLVSALVLSWIMEGGLGYIMFHGRFILMHTLCPLIAAASFVWFEKYSFYKWDVIGALGFTVVYAAALIILNILKVVEGPYPFLMVYQQPIYMSVLWCVIILGGSYGVARLLLDTKEQGGDEGDD